MNKKQIESMLAEIVKKSSLFDSVPVIYGRWVTDNLEETIKLWMGAIEGRFALSPCGSLNLSGIGEEFVARNKFVITSIDDDSECGLAYLGERFCDEFLDVIVMPTKGGVLYGFFLQNDSSDSSIINELGGEKKAETSLCDLLEYMSIMFRAHNGEILTCLGGGSCLFFIRNKSGRLRVVDFTQYGGNKWSLEAFPLDEGMSSGRYVFSRCNPFKEV